MNDRKTLERLSAHIDGEAPEPEAVEALLERDPEARRLYDELVHAGELVRELPAPEVSPAFAARVMARVADEEPELRPWWRPVLLMAAPVLAVALLVAALALTLRLPVHEGAPGPVAGVEENDGVAGGEAVEELVLQIAAGNGFGADWLSVFPSTDVLDNEAERLIAELEPALDAASDLDTLVSTLSAEEAEIFRQLLLQYAGQENPS